MENNNDLIKLIFVLVTTSLYYVFFKKRNMYLFTLKEQISLMEMKKTSFKIFYQHESLNEVYLYYLKNEENKKNNIKQPTKEDSLLIQKEISLLKETFSNNENEIDYLSKLYKDKILSLKEKSKNKDYLTTSLKNDSNDIDLIKLAIVAGFLSESSRDTNSIHQSTDYGSSSSSYSDSGSSGFDSGGGSSDSW